MAEDAPWKAKAANKQAAEYAKIPEAWRLSPEFLKGDETSDLGVMDVPAKCGILNSTELDITESYTAVSLATAVQSGKLKAVDVARAFSKRAAIAQQLTSCLTETFFDHAIQRGEYLDLYLAEHKKPLGPLHGVPISIKDPFNYVGVATTLGFVSYLDHELPKENSPLTDILLELGAILYCKTNIPQTMMTADSQNNVFGRTLNPHKLKLGAGGSSGGEGALVALRGSILGIGTDIGGSIRIPALCCGTYGFKPSTQRIPYGGQGYAVKPGSPGIPPCAGPLANSFEDLEFLVRHVINAKPWDRDATAMPFPWRASIAASPQPSLRVGYIHSDPDLPIHPPVARALETSAKKLSDAGITVVPLKNFPSFKDGMELTSHMFSLDNTRTILSHMTKSGEPIIRSLQKTMSLITMRDHYSLEDAFDLNVDRIKYKTQWNKLWVENNLDVILCPGAQNTAVLHDDYGPPPYTAVFNLLEYPGVILPVGFADRNVDTEDIVTPDPARTYRSEDVDGAPTVIQLVSRNYHDEELVAAAAVIDKALKQ
ncbi:hypothetical protein LTR37_000209 [Vermiconidia calcicola]|uniref:Uncharacterized protein n=1 Tax=Vermiconidia calcicola TaxID=1690605 RepID=A0ACC3NZR2_9PEZI|nr:hypothetical protein LTR37_000209 [Vermiconidia calcicola]